MSSGASVKTRNSMVLSALASAARSELATAEETLQAARAQYRQKHVAFSITLTVILFSKGMPL